MYHEDTEIIYPLRVTPALRDLHGPDWRKAADAAAKAGPDGLKAVSFVLAMARVAGCQTCNADSFRAMKGCTACAQDAVRRYRGGEKALLKQVEKAQADMEKTG
ncbi:MAG: hypothetical protein KIS85_03210 [Anaerolineales bacterium]|nr:hypothetical protein [Anaerolineales bacterium]